MKTRRQILFVGVFGALVAVSTGPKAAVVAAALPESKGLLAVSHRSHDYRDPVLQIDLTQEGPADWLYCGADEAAKSPVICRKAGVSRLIGKPRTVAGTTRVYKDNRPLRFNFSDGTPIEKLADSQVAWWFMHADAHGAGLEIPLAADTRERVAKVFLGYWHGTGRFRARFSDDSAPPFEEIVKKTGWENRVYILRYRSGSPDQKLIISFECTGAGNKEGNIEFQAVAIRNADDVPAEKPPVAPAATKPHLAWAKATVVANRVQPACQPVGYSSQRLDQQSYLGQRMDINYHIGLLKTFSVDDYLNSYGKNPKWPSGEYLGKFMQGLSRMYLYTGDPPARARLDRIVKKWLAIQEDDGWLGTCERFKSWDIWEHKYVLLGLVDYYALTGNEKALTAARRIGDLYCDTIGPGKGDINHSGHWAMGSESILEPMVYLYRYTGEPRYLRFCEYVVDSFESATGPKLISTLTIGSKRVCDIEDPWANRSAREVKFKFGSQIRNRSKGYEMLSCIIGLARMYQLTGKPEYLTVAVNAWKDITENRLYLCGSSGADECFKDDHCLPAESTDGPAEACVTAHWIFFNRILFEITGEPRYVDAIENSLYNYMLASQRPQDCFQSYNTGMNGKRNFARHDPTGKVRGAPCCISSTMRELARTPEVIWTKFTDNGLGVLIYNTGWMEDTIRTAEGETLTVRVDMQTDYPKTGDVTLGIRQENKATFRLALRVPEWCRKFQATIEGQTNLGKPGQFLNLNRTWRPGDTITITMDMNDRLMPGGASYPGHFAFMHGPQVLTLVAGKGGRIVNAQVEANTEPALEGMPGFLPKGWIGEQAYQSPALVNAGRCVLVPFADAGQPELAPDYQTWIVAEPETTPSPPAAPSGLVAKARNKNRIAISWKDNSQTEHGFRIERRRRDVGVWFHVKTTLTDVIRAEDGSVNVVLPGKTYSYRVTAFNNGGRSAYSNEATVTTPGVSLPSAPAALKAKAVAESQIDLVWNDRSDNEEGFRVERKIGAQGEWELIAGRIPANLPAFTDYGLEPRQSYAYRTQSYNAAGESQWSNEVKLTTQKPKSNQSEAK